MPFSIIIFLAIILIGSISAVFYFFRINRRLKIELNEHTNASNRRMYELAILKELGERAGYSLDVQKIIDIITGSLGQLIDYSAVASMLVNPENVDFKIHLEKSVSRKFVDDVRDRMLKSLGALLEREFTVADLKETVSGAIMVAELEEPVQSFFNIPLVIGEKVVGVLTVANTKAGLYKEDEMTILYKITNQASEAVHRLQEVVETEQRKLNAMMESMSEGVIMTDTEYRILVANPAARSAAGIDPGKKDISIFDFIDSFSGSFDIRGKLEESVKLDKMLVEKEVFLHDRFYQIIVSPVKNKAVQDGGILGGVVILHDTTSEKQAEKMREDFTSMIVHELRSPLSNIKKVVERINKTVPDKRMQKYDEYIPSLYKEASGMLGLVNNLLDVSKLESGKFTIHREPTDIRTLVKERVDFFTPTAEQSKVSLQVSLDTRIPRQINVDPLRFVQILNNLLSNALKFTKEGGSVSIIALYHTKGQEIAAEAKEAGIVWPLNETIQVPIFSHSVIIAVTDTGIGIAAEHIKKVFDKFEQFEKARTQSGDRGTGLGLTIVKGIVEAHGGTVGVVSKEDVGSTFYFSLSLVQPEEMAQENGTS